MDYCTEIAVLHGAFACIQTEIETGKYNLLDHTKGTKSSRPYVLIRDAILEIITGLETPHGQTERRKWSRLLHDVLFCKMFLFNKHFELKDGDDKNYGKTLMSYEPFCRPIPDFHPHMFFELSDEFDWTEFLGEIFAQSDLPTALNFTKHSLMFCSAAPAVLYDLGLMSATMNLLLSALFCEMIHAPQIEAETCTGVKEMETSPKVCVRGSMPQQTYKDLEKQCLEAAVQKDSECVHDCVLGRSDVTADLVSEEDKRTHDNVSHVVSQLMLDKVLERVDQTAHDRIIQLIDSVIEALTLVQKRLSTKLFDRSSCKSGAMATVLPVLGHILALVITFWVLSSCDKPSNQLRHSLKTWILGDEDEEVGSVLDNDCVSSTQDTLSNGLSGCEQDESVDLVAEALTRLSRTSEMRRVCMKCLRSFFTAQPSTGGQSQALSKEKSLKFSRVLKLNLHLYKLPNPVRLIRVVQVLCRLLECGSQDKDAVGELDQCLLTIQHELRKREKVAEEKRLNPSLAVVMDILQKKLPRWEWCLQYGLAKTDLKNWWTAGFLEFLHMNPGLLISDSDVRRLLTLLHQISLSPSAAPKYQHMCTEVVLKTLSQLPLPTQDQVLIEVYQNSRLSSLEIVPDFDRSVIITFNKLSTDTVHKNLHDILRLAFHDLLTFTRRAVDTAISNKGQIPVVVQVLQLTPEAMKCVHPKNHPNHSLLCHCLHAVLSSRCLDPTEQNNCLQLLSLLMQPCEKASTQDAPLLSPSEFLMSSVLPYIDLDPSHHLITLDFTLRLLIGCLNNALCIGFSDWQDVHPVVILRFCAATLQECVDMVGNEKMNCSEVEQMLSLKVLVLSTMDVVLMLIEAGSLKPLEGPSLGWLQDQCLQYDWTVSAYMAPFLVPSDSTGPNPVTVDLVSKVLAVADKNPAPLLQLSAVSKSAAAVVSQALPVDLQIKEMTLLHSLIQILPYLLTTEVHRVVEVLLALVDSNTVCMDPVDDSYQDYFHYTIGDMSELMVSKVLMEAGMVIITRESDRQTSIVPHAVQVFVAALQALLGLHKTASSPAEIDRSLILYKTMFFQICCIMSASPDYMLDCQFILLLDILVSMLQQEPVSGDRKTTSCLRESLMNVIELIPRRSLRNILYKKLYNEECVEQEIVQSGRSEDSGRSEAVDVLEDEVVEAVKDEDRETVEDKELKPLESEALFQQ